MPHEAIPIIKKAVAMPGICVEGIYSHLAQAANPDQSFNREQETVFVNLLETLERENIHIPYKHLSNSAGTTALAAPNTNLVRLGLGCLWLVAIACK